MTTMPLSISLLGPMQVARGERPLVFATDKSRALLAYLAAEAESPHRREMLAGLLWPDQPERKARQNLRQTLSYLRQALGETESAAGGEPVLLVTRDTIQFNPGCNYTLDVAEFATLTAACKAHRHRRTESCRPCLMRLEQAAGLYRGDFLAQFFLHDSDVFEEWTLLKREWLHRHATEAMAALADYYERRGELDRAQHYAWRQVELEPWREEAHRQLMRLLALDGQRSAALAQYETCRRVLAQELHIEPTNETVMLYEWIQAEETRRPPITLSPSHLVTPSPPLPLSPTSFVGRETELAELADLLANPDCHLVTLLGPGGIGKTRLALQVAADHVGVFEHGVYFAPLGPVNQAEFIAPAIAQALNFSFQGQKAPTEQLLDYLQEKETLLVLDNMEHLLEGINLLAQILRRAPDVKLLVTSRERLNLQEEWVYGLEGLVYPTSPFTPLLAGEGQGVRSKTYSAIQLFEQRARQAHQRFSLARNETHVARICQLVEGMPLGIELAAAHVALHTCQEIVGHIERNLNTLSSGLHNVPERHKSIHATFEYSWELLTQEERQVLAKLAVLQGGFTLDAAERIAGTHLVTLRALVNKSLVRSSAERFQLHPLLKQYAAEKLGQDFDQEQAARVQHASYYAAFLDQREKSLKGFGQLQALVEIETELDNIRSAWQWVVTQIKDGRDKTQAVSILQQGVESLYLFYLTHGLYHEGETVLGHAAEALMALEESQGDSAILLGRLLARQGKCCEFTRNAAKATRLFESSLDVLQRASAWEETGLPLHGLGYAANLRGEHAQATEYFRQSLDVYRRCQDLSGIANTLNNMGLVARRQGDFAQARQLCQEALAIRRQMGDQLGIASSLNNLGLIQCEMGEYTAARRDLEEALEISQRLNYKVMMANVLTNLCHAALRTGQIETARQFEERSLALCRDIGDYWGVAIALNNLGHIAMETNQHARAKRLFEEGIAIFREIGVKAGWANALGNLGEVCYELGDLAQARRHLRQAVQIAWEIGATPTVLENLIRLARLLAKEEKALQGLELLAFVKQQFSTAEVEENSATLFAELAASFPPKVVAKAETRGLSFNLDSLVRGITDAP